MSTPRWRYPLELGYNSPGRTGDGGVVSDQLGELEAPPPIP
jgi:hypothetical protein